MSEKLVIEGGPWGRAIESFAAAQRRQGLKGSTIERRVKIVRRLARGVHVQPWAVDSGQLERWLQGLPCGEEAVRVHRSGVRAFYGWGYRAGMIFDDPSADVSRQMRRLPVPAFWVPEIKAWRSYLRSAGRPETTVKSRVDALSRFARETVLQPWAVTLDDLIEWMAGKRWAQEYRRSNRATLISFYAWAFETGRVAVNPAAKFPIVKASQPSPRPVTDDAYREALAAADPRSALMLRLSAEVGLRRGEVAVIHSKDYLDSGGHALLVVHGKGSKDRVLPLPAGLAAELHALPAGFAFPGRAAGHLSPRYVGKVVSELLPIGVTMHGLRHRFATRAYDVDRDVFTVQRLLGHASPATTQRYVQVTDSAMRRLVEAVSG